MSTETNRETFFSLLIGSTLDIFGFGRDAVSVRAKQAEIFSDATSAEYAKYGIPISILKAGSSGEGTNLKDSDVDGMLINNDTVCVDRVAFTRYFNILKIDKTDTPPGYTRLESVHLYYNDTSLIGDLLSVSDMYQSSSGYPFISSSVFRNMFFKEMQILPYLRYDKVVVDNNSTTNGPAFTFEKITSESENIGYDYVCGLYYYGKDIIRRMRRKRIHNWPPKDILKDLSDTEGYVVPVGMKESENVNIEWRVCYTTAEMKLVGSLNDIQIKLYILLKMIAKNVKQKCKPFSSYLVKNVVFWIAEGSPPNQFAPDLLIFLVTKSLCFIKHCLQNNYLPNYIIPERNMLTGAFSRQDKHDLLRIVTEYLENDSLNYILHTNVKLKKCVSYVYTCPRFTYIYGQWRNEVERLNTLDYHQKLEHLELSFLGRRTFLDDFEKSYSRDKRYFKWKLKLFSLLVPNWLFLLFEGSFSSLYNERMKLIQML